MIATAAHPGVAATNLLRFNGRRARHRAQKTMTGLISQSEKAGAVPTLYATVGGHPGQQLRGTGRVPEARGAPKPVGRSNRAKGADAARRLWHVSEKLTGVAFPNPVREQRR